MYIGRETVLSTEEPVELPAAVCADHDSRESTLPEAQNVPTASGVETDRLTAVR